MPRLRSERPVHARRHAVRQDVRLHHLDEQRAGVAEVEPIALPRPFHVPGVLEPTAADSCDLVRGTVGATCVRDLTPQPDHLALALIDDHGLVRVGPAVEAIHLEADRVVPDFVATHCHEVHVRSVVPAVGGVLGVTLRHQTPVAFGLGSMVRVEPLLNHGFDLVAWVTAHDGILLVVVVRRRRRGVGTGSV